MKLQLINGSFSAKDAIELLNQMVQAKVKYHEKQISVSASEEDIKTREKRIKDLQKELETIRRQILSNGYEGVDIQAEVVLHVSVKTPVELELAEA